MDYEKMLKRAKDELPEISDGGERFSIPKIKGHIQGNKTVLTNFLDIAKTLRRKPEHLLKFILKELATPGEIIRDNVIVGRKVPASFINDKIEEYAEIYVICKECGKPDTKLISEGRFIFMTCQACGARSSVPNIK